MNKKGYTIIELLIEIVVLVTITIAVLLLFNHQEGRYGDNSYKNPQEQTSSRYHEGDTVVLKIFPESKCIVSQVGLLDNYLSRVRCVSGAGVISSLEYVSFSELQ